MSSVTCKEDIDNPKKSSKRGDSSAKISNLAEKMDDLNLRELVKLFQLVSKPYQAKIKGPGLRGSFS